MTFPALDSSVRVLLPQGATLVLNLFRRFDRFRRSYQQQHLDAAAESLRAAVGEVTADGIMSDAIMLDNELRLRTPGRFEFLADGSPTASADELALLGILAAMQAGDSRRAAEHALKLEIVQARALMMLAYKLGARLSAAGIRLEHAAFETDWPTPAAREAAPSGSFPGLRVVAGSSLGTAG